VIEKQQEVYEQYFANAYRGVYRFGARVDDELEATREKVRQLIGARTTDEIIFTAGTTMSINMVAQAWGRRFLEPGDEILLNEMEHHANIVPWQLVAQERGAKLTYLPLTSDWRLDLSRLDEFLTEKTRMVAVCGMSNVLGTINPIDAIIERARAVGALVLVDGAQSVPHQPVNVVDSNIDFLAFSGHKLFGPSGVGILYGREELLAEMPPFLGGGHMIDEVFHDHSTWAPLPAKFEAGTLPIVQAIGLGTAIDYVQSLGFDRIRAYEHELLEYAYEQLQRIPGMRIYGPDLEHKGPIVSFTMDGAHAEDLAQLLDRKGVFVRHGHHCAMLLHKRIGVPATVRASMALYNTRDDIDRLVSALQFARERLRLV
jgi:cysteine desulfurase/selenocysteine lyase